MEAVVRRWPSGTFAGASTRFSTTTGSRSTSGKPTSAFAHVFAHLTNQRTDAVAMSVLDPFEVFEIEVWPLPQLQGSPRTDADARQQLDALERLTTAQAIENSQFKAILNEKDRPPGKLSNRGAAVIFGVGSFPSGYSSSDRTRTSDSRRAH